MTAAEAAPVSRRLIYYESVFEFRRTVGGGNGLSAADSRETGSSAARWKREVRQ